MARTPLFALVRRSLRLAALASRPGNPPADECVEMLAERQSRREFLQKSAAAGALIAVPDLFSAFAQERVAGPRVAIVGAGIAGLNCAHKLRKANLPVRIFEAS